MKKRDSSSIMKFINGIRSEYQIINVGDFSIFSKALLKQLNYKPWDDTYIHGYEDIDLSLRLLKEGIYNSASFLNYDIGSMESATAGRSKLRSLRDIANKAYFNLKFKKSFEGKHRSSSSALKLL
ncbi:glycosyltransferase family 2 protein [Picrophilus oshimae]|uniref:glycosyltransferase family 2 protein n=1 Tax=Picrophilus oshimae TaxID=46632 RepID=UPI000A070F75|nr:hypothetical protein [Picrophilus oshimae]